jgi:5'(3')-deoxyribonucleotidase
LRIYIDVDGVLADFVSRILLNYNAKHGTVYTHDDIQTWDFTDILQPGQEWQDYVDQNFWGCLDIYPWAHQLVAAVRASGRPYAFLTALSDDNSCTEGSALAARERWLDRHFMIDPLDPPSSRMIATIRKDLVVAPGDILIDDSARNIQAIRNVGGTAWALAQPLNQGVEGRMTPDEIMDALQRLNTSA